MPKRSWTTNHAFVLQIRQTAWRTGVGARPFDAPDVEIEKIACRESIQVNDLRRFRPFGLVVKWAAGD